MSIEFLFLFNGKCRTFSPGSFFSAVGTLSPFPRTANAKKVSQDRKDNDWAFFFARGAYRQSCLFLGGGNAKSIHPTWVQQDIRGKEEEEEEKQTSKTRTDGRRRAF